MNKGDLISFVAENVGTTKVDAKKVVNAVLEGISTGMMETGKVSLVGFGTFEVVKRAARKGRNPQTGDEMDIPEKWVPKFKPSSALREAMVEGFEPVEDAAE